MQCHLRAKESLFGQYRDIQQRLTFTLFPNEKHSDIHPINIICILYATPLGEDWRFGRKWLRNMISSETKVHLDFDPGEMGDDEKKVDLSTTKNIKWVAKLGSQAYGNVTVGNGCVFVGTNNESPRDLKKKGDRGVVMCFDEVSGDLKWQLVIPKLGARKVSDWEYMSMLLTCSRRR